jgi:hypothetical protein
MLRLATMLAMSGGRFALSRWPQKTAKALTMLIGVFAGADNGSDPLCKFCDSRRGPEWQRRSSHPTWQIAGFCTAYSPQQKESGPGCRTIAKIDVL